MFETYLTHWNLLPDGEPIATHGSDLLPVRLDGRADGEPAMLKIARDEQERFGALVMRWWDGVGAARVYAHRDDALLMERAPGSRSLMPLAVNGRDDEASRIACAVLAQLHAPRTAPPPQELVSLGDWFASLWPFAECEGGILRQCAAVARALLAEQREIVVLHADLHHENVLDFGARGWLAIDPKRVRGDRGYDYANLLANHELPTVADPARFARQSHVVAQAAGLERRRLLRWTLAYAGLSAAWFAEDGNAAGAQSDLTVAGFALNALRCDYGDVLAD